MVDFGVFAPGFIILDEKYLHWPQLMFFTELGQYLFDIFTYALFSSPLHIHRLLRGSYEKLGRFNINIQQKSVWIFVEIA